MQIRVKMVKKNRDDAIDIANNNNYKLKLGEDESIVGESMAEAQVWDTGHRILFFG